MQTLDLENDEIVDNSDTTKLSWIDKITLDTYKEEITNYHG